MIIFYHFWLIVKWGASVIWRKRIQLAEDNAHVHSQAPYAARSLASILDRHRNKRVLVAGVPCSGKSTLLKYIPGALDMDVELFPKLSREEKIFAFQSVFNPESGRFERAPHDYSDPKQVAALELSNDALQALAQMHLEIVPGHPLFATLIIPTDVIVYLNIDDELLRERLALREARNDRPQPYDFVKMIEIILERQIVEAQRDGVIVEEFVMMRGLHDV